MNTIESSADMLNAAIRYAATAATLRERPIAQCTRIDLGCTRCVSSTLSLDADEPGEGSDERSIVDVDAPDGHGEGPAVNADEPGEGSAVNAYEPGEELDEGSSVDADASPEGHGGGPGEGSSADADAAERPGEALDVDVDVDAGEGPGDEGSSVDADAGEVPGEGLDVDLGDGLGDGPGADADKAKWAWSSEVAWGAADAAVRKAATSMSAGRINSRISSNSA
jgi:hypothetical protein